METNLWFSLVMILGFNPLNQVYRLNQHLPLQQSQHEAGSFNPLNQVYRLNMSREEADAWCQAHGFNPLNQVYRLNQGKKARKATIKRARF